LAARGAEESCIVTHLNVFKLSRNHSCEKLDASVDPPAEDRRDSD